jgi:hypothetical protein
MADVTGDAERGDIEARFREALEKDRRQAEQLRRNAWAVWRAMEGWQRVRSEEEWVKICEESREEYKSGRFLLEQLGAERHLDPKLMATLLHLRQDLIAEWRLTTAPGTMLADLAVLSFYHTVRTQGWIGNLALHIEHAFFAQDGGDGRAVEDHVRRLTEHLMPLLDRANRMFIRNLKAIKELGQGPVPAISIGLAEQVTVTNQQNGRAPRNGHGRRR